MILPGDTLGLLGGGQLGQMFTLAARRMGYEVILLAPEVDCPASAYASEHVCRDYLDADALNYLGSRCAAITTEFENVPAQALTRLESCCPVRPGARAVWITQDRIREKSFLRRNRFATAPFAIIRSEQELATAVYTVGLPAILKSSRFGYDGKGQIRVTTREELRHAWQQLQCQPCVLEALIELDMELSVVLARGVDGSMTCFPISENKHRNGILDWSITPARVDAGLQHMAIDIAQRVATQLGYIGVMTVELFFSKGKLLVNEIAPRPHNSGHYTLDACRTSQFAQQVRAVCGLPLGPADLLSPAVMVNLMGDLWGTNGAMPDWRKLLIEPCVTLHLYGKREARSGRKMGHFTCVDKDVESALSIARHLRAGLGPADNVTMTELTELPQPEPQAIAV